MEANTRLFSDVKNDSDQDVPRKKRKTEDSQTDTSQIVTPSNNTTSEVKFYNEFVVSNQVLSNEYNVRRAVDRGGVNCKAIEFSMEEFLELDALVEPVSTVFSYSHQQSNDNTSYLVIEDNESIANLLASVKFKDDMEDSEKRMAIVLLLLDIAVKLELSGLQFGWSVHTIYYRSSYFWLNILGVSKCLGKRSSMENRTRLISLFRYILTGDEQKRALPEQEYVFKHMLKNTQPLSYKVWEIASFVFNHVKILEFFNGIGEHSIKPFASSKLAPDTITNHDLSLMLKELDHKILIRRGRLTDNWFQPGGDTHSPCTQICAAIKFPKQDGNSMERFQLFFRNFPEHWRDKKSMLTRLEAIFNNQLKLKAPISTARDGKPTFIYRFVRNSYPLIFVKYYKIVKKHLANRNSDMSVIFKRNDEEDVKKARLYLDSCL